MSIQWPGSLEWVFYLVGGEWPQGDEDGMWALGDEWRSSSDHLSDLIPELNRVRAETLSVLAGQTAQAADQEFAKLFDGDYAVDKLGKAMTALGNLCDSCGTNIEYTKISMIFNVAQAAAEILYAFAMAAPTWGGSLAAVPVIETVTTQTIRQLVSAILKRIFNVVEDALGDTIVKRLLREGLEDVAWAVVQESVVQGIQVANGHRDGLDASRFGTTALAGFVGGAANQGTKELIEKRMLALAGNRFERIVAGTLSGYAGGTVGNVAGTLASGGQLTAVSVLGSGTTSAVKGGIKGNFARPSGGGGDDGPSPTRADGGPPDGSPHPTGDSSSPSPNGNHSSSESSPTSRPSTDAPGAEPAAATHTSEAPAHAATSQGGENGTHPTSSTEAPSHATGGDDGPQRSSTDSGPQRTGEDSAPTRSSGDDSAPPRSAEESGPSRTSEDSAPPRTSEDSAPPRASEDSAPPRASEDSAPPRTSEESAPPRASEDSAPTRSSGDDSAPPRSTEDSGPHRTNEDSAPPRSPGDDAGPPRSLGDETPTRAPGDDTPTTTNGESPGRTTGDGTQSHPVSGTHPAASTAPVQHTTPPATSTNPSGPPTNAPATPTAATNPTTPTAGTPHGPPAGPTPGSGPSSETPRSSPSNAPQSASTNPTHGAPAARTAESPAAVASTTRPDGARPSTEHQPPQPPHGPGGDDRPPQYREQHVVSFNEGSTPDTQNKRAEYESQIAGQIDGLNDLTANEILFNMDNGKRGGEAQTEARQIYYAERYAEVLADAHELRATDPDALGGLAPQTWAHRTVTEEMKGLAALHTPDLVAGGYDRILFDDTGKPLLGDTWVNSSLGSQWNSRVPALRSYIERMVAQGFGDYRPNVGWHLN